MPSDILVASRTRGGDNTRLLTKSVDVIRARSNKGLVERSLLPGFVQMQVWPAEGAVGTLSSTQNLATKPKKCQQARDQSCIMVMMSTSLCCDYFLFKKKKTKKKFTCNLSMQLFTDRSSTTTSAVSSDTAAEESQC